MDQNQITIRSIEPKDTSAFNALKKTIEGTKKCSIRIGERILDERCFGLILNNNKT